MKNPLAEQARVYAKAAHKGQVRKYTGVPYFNHCSAVALCVKYKGGSDAMIAAAYLHDTVEDTDVTEIDILDEFGSEVWRLVLELTDKYTPIEYPELNRKRRKRLEAQRWLTATKEAIAIKLCDLNDNTKDLIKHDPKFAVVYLRDIASVLEAIQANTPIEADIDTTEESWANEGGR